MVDQIEGEGQIEDERVDATSGRRRLLIAGVAGAVAGVFVRGGEQAAASSGTGDQGPLILGSNDQFKDTIPSTNTANVSSVSTVVKASPNYGNFINASGAFVFKADASPSGFGDINGLWGVGRGLAAGVHGTSAAGFGVLGEGIYGLIGTSDNGVGCFGDVEIGVGVFGSSDQGVGGVFRGAAAAIRLSPAEVGGAPTTGAHEVGELVVDSSGILYLCKSTGTPGTWVKLSEQATGGAPVAASFKTLPTPDRLVDTRIALGGVQGPVPAGTTSTFQMTGRVGASGNPALRVPDNATALVGNLTVIGGPSASIGSFVTLWPSGDRPTTSSINFGPGSVVANSYTVGVAIAGGHGYINAFAQQGCDYLIDVVGYFS
jgi:hypothetical protein